MDLRGAVTIVTGAGSDNGRAIAVALARQGAASVAVVDLDETAVQESVAAVRAAGGRATGHFVDVADPVSMAKLFADVSHEEGPVDVVCNNGRTVTGDPGWPETSLARLSSIVDVHLTAVIVGTRLAVGEMSGRGGVVVNVAPTEGVQPPPADAVYAAARAGVVHFTASCASLADSHGVRVNVVCPGAVRTPALAAVAAGTAGATTGDEPAPAAGVSAEPGPSADIVADAVLAVITDDARAGEVVILADV